MWDTMWDAVWGAMQAVQTCWKLFRSERVSFPFLLTPLCLFTLLKVEYVENCFYCSWLQRNLFLTPSVPSPAPPWAAAASRASMPLCTKGTHHLKLKFHNGFPCRCVTPCTWLPAVLPKCHCTDTEPASSRHILSLLLLDFFPAESAAPTATGHSPASTSTGSLQSGMGI